MGQPLATCCNPVCNQRVEDTQLQPLQREALTSAKASVDIAQLIKARHEPLTDTLNNARKHGSSRSLHTSEETESTWCIEVTGDNQQTDWVVCKGVRQEKNINGEMTVYFPNGQLFQGKIVQNQPTNGIYIFKKGCFYIGDILDFNAQGKGRYQNFDAGYVYQGTFSKSLPHGKGTESYKNGDSYQGEMMYGQKFGQGIYRFADGKSYIGSFYLNQSDGKGKMIYPDASYYEGEWKLGKYNGFGKFAWANGQVYVGDYVDGLRHGKGKYSFKFQGGYEGEWKVGLQSGKGKYCEGYDTIEGIWQSGEFLG